MGCDGEMIGQMYDHDKIKELTIEVEYLKHRIVVLNSAEDMLTKLLEHERDEVERLKALIKEM